MLPALFFASQLYNVTCGVLVGAMYNGDVSSGIATLFSYHCIVGVGSPLAVQYMSNLVPTLTVQFDP